MGAAREQIHAICSLALPKFVIDESQQCIHRHLLIRAIGFDDNSAANTSGQHHHAHDAFGVDAALALAHPDLARKAAGEFGQFRGGPGVQAQFIADVRAVLDHVFCVPDFAVR